MMAQLIPLCLFLPVQCYRYYLEIGIPDLLWKCGVDQKEPQIKSKIKKWSQIYQTYKIHNSDYHIVENQKSRSRAEPFPLSTLFLSQSLFLHTIVLSSIPLPSPTESCFQKVAGSMMWPATGLCIFPFLHY